MRFRKSGFFQKGEENIGSQSMVPENVSYLSELSNTAVNYAEIGFYWNSKLQHLRISNFKEPSYYGDYFMTTTYSQVMQQLQEDQCKRLLSLMRMSKVENLSVVEIGCGDGSFLDHAMKHFEPCIGIEPSKTFANAASIKGHNIINAYVTSESDLLEKQVGSFVSRQVFEHLPDPLDCLRGIKKMLLPGAIGLIEVPNGYKAFRSGNFYEFFPDHVNYYSVNSLVALASAAGFNVISCEESFGGDYLELWIRNDLLQDSWVDLMNVKTQLILDNIRIWAEENGEKKLAIFGCGAKTLSIIAKDPHFFSKRFSYVVDSDPNKQGKYVPNTQLPVNSLERAAIEPAESVLILALSYVDEIARMVREKFGASVEVYSIDNSGILVPIGV